jgi:hypothetical protein
MFAHKSHALAAATLLLLPLAAHAQTAPQPGQPQSAQAPPRPDPPTGGRLGPNWNDFAVTDSVVPLKVQIVISRYQGEKKLSSLPYSLSVNANDKQVASLRMGAQVPLPTMVTPAVEPGKPSPFGGPVQYREIGTYIDCSARALDAGRFRLSISIEDSSVYGSDGAQGGAAATGVPPAIRSFKLSNTAVLRDGQSTQFTTATDKLSGEVTRIDLTLTVVK